LNSKEQVITLADLASFPLPPRVAWEIDVYMETVCQKLSIRRYRMEYAAKEALRDGVTETITLVGWAIAYDSFGRWLDAEQEVEASVLSHTALVHTRRRFSWFAGDAARYLHREHSGNVVRRTVNTLLYRVGLSSTAPLTMNDYYHMILSYADIYLDRFQPSLA